jgi:hypothetical protein
VRDRFEQLIGPAKQSVARIRTIVPGVGRIDGNQMPLAMLTNNPSPKILDANLQPPAASGTFLDEVGGIGHTETSSSDWPFRVPRVDYRLAASFVNYSDCAKHRNSPKLEIYIKCTVRRRIRNLRGVGRLDKSRTAPN